MKPIIKTIEEKKLVGKRLTMSLSGNRTAGLWKSFMPMRREILNAVSPDLYSINVYDAGYFENFSAQKTFEKWAAVEVPNFDDVPETMETYILSEGLYAVFHYKGLSTDTSIFQYIFNTWLPNSSYVLDNRPHFEVLGEKYKNNDPNSEEEIWIPVKAKKSS